MTTDPTPYSKKLTLPADVDPPRRLEFDDVVAHAPYWSASGMATVICAPPLPARAGAG